MQLVSVRVFFFFSFFFDFWILHVMKFPTIYTECCCCCVVSVATLKKGLGGRDSSLSFTTEDNKTAHIFQCTFYNYYPGLATRIIVFFSYLGTDKGPILFPFLLFCGPTNPNLSKLQDQSFLLLILKYLVVDHIFFQFLFLSIGTCQTTKWLLSPLERPLCSVGRSSSASVSPGRKRKGREREKEWWSLTAKQFQGVRICCCC